LSKNSGVNVAPTVSIAVAPLDNAIGQTLTTIAMEFNGC
jgi:hypothetical protein